jgi:medium-chain acyl-[acyl-carrier-protein] hydrolase
LDELRLLNGIPEAALQHPELIELMLPTLRADFAVYEAYAYLTEPPLAYPISAFGGTQDDRVHPDNLQAWRDQTSAGPFSMQMFPGDHFFLHTAQQPCLRYSEHVSKIPNR